MASFVLVHGSWHGAWCWELVVPRLRDAGHEVVAIDLPAHGEDRTSPLRASMASYSRCVQQAAKGCAHKPVLVGHSMGGMAITQAAMDAKGLASALVYLCAFVPQPGQSLVALGRQDAASRVMRSTRLGFGVIRVRPERARGLFYEHCSEEIAAGAAERLRPEPWRPLFQKLKGNMLPVVPRGYIECTKDRAISLDRQRDMARHSPFDEIASLETDHSPFFSMPDELTGLLDRMAKLAD